MGRVARTKLSVSMSEVLADKIRKDATDNGLTVSAWIQMILTIHYRGLEAMGQLSDIKDIVAQLQAMPREQLRMLQDEDKG